MIISATSSEFISSSLIENKIVIMPTDTVYGIHGLASKQDVVEHIYELKQRDKDKPFIILIGHISDLLKFNINLDQKTLDFLNRIWPNSISVVLPCLDKNLAYLHRGTNSLAFRIPKDEHLQSILQKTGSIVSTSANISDKPTAKDIQQAKDYFGDNVDLYIDGGVLENPSSTVIEIINGKVNVLRQGQVKIEVAL